MPPAQAADWPSGDGEMARLIRARCWTTSSLGPVEAWPQCLRIALDLMLPMPQPACLVWGGGGLLFYNDGCIPLLEAKHPLALGQPARQVWPQIWDGCLPVLKAVTAGATQVAEDRSPPHARAAGDVVGHLSWSCSPIRDAAGAVQGAFCVSIGTAGKISRAGRSEAADRPSNGPRREASAFLLRLSDNLRAQPDASTMANLALRLLAAELGLDRCCIAEMDISSDRADIPYQFVRSGFPPIPTPLRPTDFPETLRQIHEQTQVMADVATDPDLEEEERRALAALRVGAFVAATLRRGEQNPVWTLAVASVLPRRWTPEEVRLVEEVAERTWSALQRIEAETALRASEEKYRSLFATMGQGYAEIRLLRDAAGRAVNQLYLELNPAFERLIGIPVSQAKGRTALEVLPDLEPWWHDAFDRILKRGVPERIEYQVASLGRWYEVFAYPRGGDRLKLLYTDITVRKRAEDALRESEARQAFLLGLSDILRTLTDPDEIRDAAVRLLSEELGLARAFYFHVEREGDRWVHVMDNVHQRDPALPPMQPRYVLDDFGSRIFTGFAAGEIVAVPDAAALPALAPEELDSFRSLRLAAFINVPLLRDGEYCAGIGAHDTAPREWTRDEIALFSETAARTWAAIERARAESALRASEARFRAFVTASSDVIYRMAPDWSEMRGLDGRGFLADTAQPSGSWMHHYIHPNDQPAVEAAIQDAIATRSVFELEHRVRRADGTLGLIFSRAVPIIDEHGDIVEWLGAAQDVTERRRNEEALRETEARLMAFGEASSDVLWMRDADTWAFTYVSPAFELIYGIAPDEVMQGDTLQNWLDLIVPEDRGHARACLERVRQGERLTYEFRVMRPADGQVRVLRNTDFPIRDAAGCVTGIAGVGHDATEEKAAAERLGVLVSELQHRTRNLLGVVRSVTDRTLANSVSLEDFRTRIRDRLEALARVNALLSRLHEGDRITFDELIRSELQAHGIIDGHDEGPRVSLRGPKGIRLRSSNVQTLALGLHELATNALKYGALSRPEGRLKIRWALLDDPGRERRLRVNWQESGVTIPMPDAASEALPPVRRGYGRELIERALPYQLSAEVAYDLTPDGVRCTITLPLSATMEDGAFAGKGDDA